MNNKPDILSEQQPDTLKYRGIECKNCGHPLEISHKNCPNCSQKNSTKKISLKDFIEEFFANIISYDSRLIRTLTSLLTKPGQITREYIEGKRVSYTNPFRFLLSLSIIYFLMINYSINYSEYNKYGEGNEKSIFKKIDTLNFNLNEHVKLDTIKGLEDKGKELIASLDSLNIGESIAKSDSIILANPKQHFLDLANKHPIDRFSSKSSFFALITKEKNISSFESLPKEYGITNTLENRYAFNGGQSILRLQREPGSFAKSLISKLPLTIFFFLPLFTLFIWLIYIRKKYNYTEHLIFSFHIESLLFILLIISFIIDTIFDIKSTALFILIFAIYLFIAMWKFYNQGFLKTIVKYIFLNTIFLILAMLAIAILLTGSAFTY